MKNRTFRLIMIPVVSIVAATAVVSTIAANMFSTVLDDYLGRGQSHVHVIENSENWDTNFYEDKYASNQESKEDSYKLARQVQDEGSVLLKNNGVLPLASETKVAPFGNAFVHPYYGQTTASGSAKWTIDPSTPKGVLEKSTLKLVNETYQAMLNAGDPDTILEAEGTLPAGKGSALMGGDSKLYEYNPSIYNGLENAVSGSVGLVFIGRSGQESSDKKYDGYADGTPHYLALSQHEKDTIRFAKEHCAKVVLIICSSATVEITPALSGELEADAILQMGHVGEKGYDSLPDLLTGKVNPSGRTVDTWAKDLTKNPTYVNFGRFTYTNATFSSHPYGTPDSPTGTGSFYRYYIEYAEDIYVGYRYYETAAVMDPSFHYEQEVAFPFGHGLSYTTFSKKITSFTEDNGKITLQVEVENTGEKAGKEVVEIYYSAPYTQFDIDNKIEKSVTNLIAFEKTSLLEPKAKETVTLSFDKEDMASYCYSKDNGDGTKGAYVLEQGKYTISLKENSHVEIESKEINVSSTTWFDSSNPRKSEKDAQSQWDNEGNPTEKLKSGSKVVAASNRFQESSDYMNKESKILTRSDWINSYPKIDPSRTKTLSQETVSLFGIEETFDPQTDVNLGNVIGSKVYAAEDRKVVPSGFKTSDMRGLDYNDPRYEEYLDQVNYADDATLNDIVTMMIGANYTSTKVDAIGLPTVVHADGANGIKAVKTNDGMGLTATYGYAPLMASTWNKDLMNKVGDMFGKEALETNIGGWYSPAINIHRNQLSGRVYEYYSEDPLLTGKIASAVVSGASNAGLPCYIKHFALNDQETNREFALHTWATEQASREIYLKAFEIPFKEAKMTVKYISDDKGTVATKVMRGATACMAAQNDIGHIMGHANYSLLTSILRDEWGFEGTVISDMYVWKGKKNLFDLSFRTGCDLFLTMMAGMIDKTSPTTHAVMRRVLHNVTYTVANSSTMQGVAPGSIVTYDMSPWRIGLIVGNVVAYTLVAGGIGWMIFRGVNEKKHPEKYKGKSAK